MTSGISKGILTEMSDKIICVRYYNVEQFIKDNIRNQDCDKCDNYSICLSKDAKYVYEKLLCFKNLFDKREKCIQDELSQKLKWTPLEDFEESKEWTPVEKVVDEVLQYILRLTKSPQEEYTDIQIYEDMKSDLKDRFYSDLKKSTL